MTKTAKHSLLFRLWIHIRGLLAFVIVVAGIVVGIISLVLPNEELYKQYVVDFLSRQWDKPVEIESISGEWKGLGPKFIISGLNIKDKDEVFVQQVTLNVNLIKYLMPKGSTGITVGINDIAVDLERKSSGKIVVKNNIKDKQSFSEKLEKLLATGTLSVNNLTLNLKDSINNKLHKINSKITVQQTSEKRAFAIELVSKDLADSIIIKSIADKSYGFMQQANWYAEVDNLSLKELSQLIDKTYLPNALIDAQMWLSTTKGNIVKLSAKVDFHDSHDSHDKSFNITSKDIELSGKAELLYTGNKKRWQAELIINDIQTQSIAQEQIRIQLNRDDAFIYLKADVLDVALLKAITQTVGISTPEFDALDVNGKITDVNIRYDTSLRRIVDANIEFHELDLRAKFGQFTQLSGVISLHDEQIRLMLDSENGTADLPDYLRGQLKWNQLLLTAQTSMQDDNIDFKINSLWCDCNDFIIDGAARIIYDEQLNLDLAFAVYDAQVNQLYKYWPSFKWKPKVLNFLDQALVTGTVEQGMILYHGQVNDYPFANNQGVFWTKSNLKSATVNYHKDWPVVKQFNAVVDTVNQQLIVKSNRGKVLDGQIKSVVARIANLKKPILTVDINAQGKDNFLIDILNQSPMKKGLEVLEQDITLSGSQKVDVDLKIPLNNPDITVLPEGTITFNHTNFQLGQFELFDLNGQLDFVGPSLYLKDLNGNFLGQDVSITGDIINQPNQDVQLNVKLQGDYNVHNFESVLGFSLPASGNAPWLFSISNTQDNQIGFTAQSDLLGVELEMPDPFAKPASKTAAFSVTCILPCIDSGWDLTYNDLLQTNFVQDQESGEITFNKMIFGQAEENISDNFGGTLEVLDVDKWIVLLTKNKNNEHPQEMPFKKMSVQVDRLIFMARELSHVKIDIEADNEGLIFNLNADEILGKITVPNELDSKGIIVQLDKLHWKAIEKEEVIETEQTSPVSSTYPALHIWIGDFIYDGIPLGESTIEVRPVAEGIRVEKFISRSDLLNLTINGTWSRDIGETGLSEFNIIMTSKDIARFLKTMGFQAPITQAETIIDMQAQWSDFPSEFEIKNISGKMRIEIGQGEVIDAKPGVGRVLGLFSLTNLPRRLILDFRDVLSKGLRFQSMKGDFVLTKGEAYTDGFVIDSSSAEIVITGKTGLANQDYEQMVYVTPRVGRVLPTIGAIAGGAVGAAAGFFVQGMFHKGLRGVGKITYKVTGSWDDPIIELIKTEEVEIKR
ncbi:MAG: TIGR02099 family protein [Proteobacteria bacterium]|nr:TIGR02099 family protein [Pseudomonadota bacterium]